MAKYDEDEYLTELILKETEADVTRVYTQAAEEVQNKLKKYLENFETKDRIKRDQLLKGEITKEEYAYWRTGQIAIGQRWEEMRDTLAQDLHNANNIARSIVNGHTPDVYALNHNYSTFRIEKESMLDTSYTLYDRYTVERLIKDQPELLPRPGARMNERIAAGKDIAWQKGQIQSVMTQSILQGESIPNISRRIARTMGESNRKSTIRYARTAVTGAQNAGRVDAYKRAEKMGIEVEQEWLATLDKRTRDPHRELDGQRVSAGHPFLIDGYKIKYPGDPSAPGYLIWNCRCTLVPVVKNVDQSNAPRNNKLGGMTYNEWKHEHDRPIEVTIPGVQGEIGRATTVEEVNAIMNSQGWFRELNYTNADGTRGVSMADLTGCDLESAKSIASSYQQVFEKYPQLKGKLDAPDAHPIGMKDNTYAWCYTRDNGKVQVNPNRYGNWNELVQRYARDVSTNWHPPGTTAESIITHELGHSIDGLLAKKGVIGGYTKSGEFRMASSSLKQLVMRKAATLDPDIAEELEIDKWLKDNATVQHHVSRYAAENNAEWFAECFAEYITSAHPRTVATVFGKELERLLGKLT